MMRHRHKYLRYISALLFAILLAAGAGTFFIHLRSTYAVDRSPALATGDGRGIWSYAAPMPQAFVDFTLTLLPNGKVLLMDSENGTSGNLVNTNLVYDPAQNSWSPVASMPTPVAGYSSTVLADGRVLVAGGDYAIASCCTPTRQEPTRQRHTAIVGKAVDYSVKLVQIYNPANNTWTRAADLPVARVDSTAMLLSDGSALLMGSDDSSTLVSTVTYHPSSNTWTSGVSLQGSSGLYYATHLPSGKILALTGNTANPNAFMAKLYSPSTGTWSSANTGYDGTQVAPVTQLHDGRLVMAGGYQPVPGSYFGTPLKETQIYHPTTNTWTRGQDLPTARYFDVLNTLPDDNVLVAGGDTSDALYTPTTQLYSAAFNTWSSGANMLDGPRYATSIVLANGQVMVAGGIVPSLPAPTPTPLAAQGLSSAGYRVGEMSMTVPNAGMAIQTNEVELYTTVPGAPSNVHAVGGNGSANVTWSQPVNGGSTIRNYVVTVSPGGQRVTVSGSVISVTVSGLTNGVTYTFGVVAINVFGVGPRATSNAVMPT